MKEYDVVELIRDRDRYAKEGVYKGMFGGIMSEKPINGEWYVIFFRAWNRTGHCGYYGAGRRFARA